MRYRHDLELRDRIGAQKTSARLPVLARCCHIFESTQTDKPVTEVVKLQTLARKHPNSGESGYVDVQRQDSCRNPRNGTYASHSSQRSNREATRRRRTPLKCESNYWPKRGGMLVTHPQPRYRLKTMCERLNFSTNSAEFATSCEHASQLFADRSCRRTLDRHDTRTSCLCRTSHTRVMPIVTSPVAPAPHVFWPQRGIHRRNLRQIPLWFSRHSA